MDISIQTYTVSVMYLRAIFINSLKRVIDSERKNAIEKREIFQQHFIWLNDDLKFEKTIIIWSTLMISVFEREARSLNTIYIHN